MKHQEGFYKGVRGADIYYQGWLPAGEARAALLIVHGLAEHSGRYMNYVHRLVPLGYAVYGIDHPGHGKSGGTRGHVKRFADYIDVLGSYIDQVTGGQPGRPLFLLGHSMGALITAAFLLDHQTGIAGAVFSGPLVKMPGNITPVTIVIGKVLSSVLPKVGLVGVEAEGVSRDPAVVQAYVTDPLVYTGKATARLSCELLKAMQQVADEAGRIALPVLIVQGSADRLVDPDGARMLHGAVGSADKTLKIYDGLYHEIHNEPEQATVLDDVQAWLEEHLPEDRIPQQARQHLQGGRERT